MYVAFLWSTPILPDQQQYITSFTSHQKKNAVSNCCLRLSCSPLTKPPNTGSMGAARTTLTPNAASASTLSLCARLCLRSKHKQPTELPKNKLTAIPRAKRHAACKSSDRSLEQGQVALDGVRELREHRLAANLHFVVPNAHKNLSLEGVREDVGVALHLKEETHG